MPMSGPILLYDGVCGFCNGFVQFILKHDRKGTLSFAPLQSGLARSILVRFPRFQDVDTVVYYEPAVGQSPERASIRTDAGLQVARYLGGAWKLFLIAWVVPRPVRDFFYDLFVQYRYRWFGKHESCVIPPPEVRTRFLDL